APLRGVIHAAGLIDDGTVCDLTASRLSRVFAPKIDGAWNLHVLTQKLPLDFFVMFSSVASVVGSPGQASHAVACAFLDAFADYRRSIGLPTLAVNWGPWGEIGKVKGARGDKLLRRGFAGLPTTVCFSELEECLIRGETHAIVMSFEFERWCEFYPAAADDPLFREIGQSALSVPSSISPKLEQPMRALTSPSRRRAAIEAHLCDQVGIVLGIDRDKISDNIPLRTIGLDSLRALEFRNRVESALGFRINMTTVWKFPTIVKLAAHLADMLEEKEGNLRSDAVSPLHTNSKRSSFANR